MAGELNVDLVALHVGSNRVLDAVGEAAVDFVGHEDGLAEAVSGWIGSSQVMLGVLAVRWEARHAQHKLRVGGLGSCVAEALVSYAANEDGSAGVLGSVRGSG
ncbi:RNA 2'-phosphotransferase [Mycobacterium riyadhense]|uniref:RNA 2'-phosphotransferase n=1 Tax=Mycobacterium riyadhense TaxID=486698 RepID=UPI001EF9D3EF|nr:RNA 2'-phosphotransferase [Mycobacterium riyadhense]